MDNLVSIVIGLMVVAGAIKFLKGVVKTIVILLIALIIGSGILLGWENVLSILGILA